MTNNSVANSKNECSDYFKIIFYIYIISLVKWSVIKSKKNRVSFSYVFFILLFFSQLSSAFTSVSP